MVKLVKIGEAATALGVTTQTLRKWEEDGQLLPDRKTAGGTRYYNLERILGVLTPSGIDLTIAYARVSSRDQKDDLKRQIEILSLFCAQKGWQPEIIKDLGSGMNYNKKGLRRLLDLILEGQITRLVLTHKDRLLRFGSELVFALCEARQVEVVIINKGENFSFEEELAQDVLEMITIFSARLYGRRNNKNQPLIELAKSLTGETK